MWKGAAYKGLTDQVYWLGLRNAGHLEQLSKV